MDKFDITLFGMMGILAVFGFVGFVLGFITCNHSQHNLESSNEDLPDFQSANGNDGGSNSPVIYYCQDLQTGEVWNTTENTCFRK